MSYDFTNKFRFTDIQNQFCLRYLFIPLFPYITILRSHYSPFFFVSLSLSLNHGMYFIHTHLNEPIINDNRNNKFSEG